MPITTRERYLESVRRELAFFRDDGSTAVARAWFDSLAGLARIIALCRERGVPLAVVLSPSHVQVSSALLEEAPAARESTRPALDVTIPSAASPRSSPPAAFQPSISYPRSRAPRAIATPTAST